MSTALSLVNRVLRLHRDGDVSDLTVRRAVPILDMVNEAKRDLLESMVWPFDRRTDGVLKTLGNTTGADGVVITGGGTVTSASGTASAAVGQRAVAKIVMGDITDYSDTAFRIVSAQNVAGPAANYTIDGAFGTGGLGLSWSIFADEYVLPATVRQVLSFRHQEDDLELIDTQAELGLDVWKPRPQEDITSTPTRVVTGKTLTATYDVDNENATKVSGIGVRIDGTPSKALVFHYSYVYRHPELSSSQDLENVDSSVEDLIVRLAYARTMMSEIGNDPEQGVLVETEVLNRIRALHAGATRDPLRRTVSRPHFRRYGTVGFGRVPRNLGSLP